MEQNTSEEKRCIVCGKVIEHPRKNAKTCCAECRYEAKKAYGRSYITEYARNRYRNSAEFREYVSMQSKSSRYELRMKLAKKLVDDVEAELNAGSDKEKIADLLISKYNIGRKTANNA